MDATLHLDVQDYYGKVLGTNADLKTNACCSLETMSEWQKSLLRNVHETVLAKFYGCGSPLPLAIEGKTVLDLGCGSGRDAFMLSQMVGEDGKVLGVDMTEEQLAVALEYVDWHAKKFGYQAPNTSFSKGYIEDLASVGIADSSVDVVISNCVINLSPQKDKVFREIYRVLKPGGELLFADVFASRRIPSCLQTDKVLLGECLGGAMYFPDFRRMMQKIGISDIRVVSSRKMEIENPDIYAKIGMIDFYSVTVQAFKVPLEDACEDYGHVAYYKGSVPQMPHRFILDQRHLFPTGQPVLICGNTANMLTETRFAEHFRVEGSFATHYGAFNCGIASDVDARAHTNASSCC